MEKIKMLLPVELYPPSVYIRFKVNTRRRKQKLDFINPESIFGKLEKRLFISAAINGADRVILNNSAAKCIAYKKGVDIIQVFNIDDEKKRRVYREVEYFLIEQKPKT